MGNPIATGTFETFCAQLLPTNRTLDFYIDTDKVLSNLRTIKIHLKQLDYLATEIDFERGVRELWSVNRDCFCVLPILVAVRDDKEILYDARGQLKSISEFATNVEDVLQFFEHTGLKQRVLQKELQSFADYVLGIEVGMGTNGRKNKSGTLMESTIAQQLSENGIEFVEQFSLPSEEALRILGKDKKRFDFCIRTQQKIFLVEVNFYSTAGSKLNEVARSFTEVAHRVNATEQYEFVWITDGQGWYNAKNKLEEAFSAIPRIYNLTTLSQFIAEVKQLQ